MRLVSWIGNTDIEAATGAKVGLGPIVATVSAHTFTSLNLLFNYPKSRVDDYLVWLGQQSTAVINSQYAQLNSPIDFHEIYLAADSLLADLVRVNDEPIAILLSPGTPAMQAVWILLGKTKYPVTFYQATLEQGVQQVDIPFEIAAEFVPKRDQQLLHLSVAQVSASAAFSDIVTQNPLMETLKRQATILAMRDVPVLIYGETGTGKELFATAIHNASPRKDCTFVPVNCGAIPPELIDSVFFGHVKGAFTGAVNHHDGVFKQADGGTLFLDEFGELPLNVQVRLLRVLQSGEVTPVGASKPIKVDVRIIAATNRDLLQEVAAGRFREDLFYRIAVGVLKLPPLRERSGDISLLAETLLSGIYASLSDREHKKLSADAKNLILKQPWRGNIRELQSTLLRASLWATGNKITAADIQQALFSMPDSKSGLLDRDVSQGVDIQELIAEIVQHYIPRALAEAKDNKTKAAELLGLKNYQTLNNWIEKYSVK
jgi:transcriptional regulator with PAS, ATPase and Fis domain